MSMSGNRIAPTMYRASSAIVIAVLGSLVFRCERPTAAGDLETPSFAEVSQLHPLPGTKRIYLHQPCDYKIVEARPDMKLFVKHATGGGYVTGLGFVILSQEPGAPVQSFDFTRTHQQFEDHAFPLLKQTVVQSGFAFEQTSFTTADAAGRRMLRLRMRVTRENEASPRNLTLGWLTTRQPYGSYYSHGNEDYIVFEPWGPGWESGVDLKYEDGVQYDGDVVVAALHASDNVAITAGSHPPLRHVLVAKIDFDRTNEAVIEATIPYEGLQRPVDSNDHTAWQAEKAFRREEAPRLLAASFDEQYAQQAGQWKRYEDQATKILVPEALVNQVYRTLTLNCLQFLGSAPGVAYYRPGQGGFNNFSVVYGWESSQYLTVMDRQGAAEILAGHPLRQGKGRPSNRRDFG